MQVQFANTHLPAASAAAQRLQRKSNRYYVLPTLICFLLRCNFSTATVFTPDQAMIGVEWQVSATRDVQNIWSLHARFSGLFRKCIRCATACLARQRLTVFVEVVALMYGLPVWVSESRLKVYKKRKYVKPSPSLPQAFLVSC